MPETEEINRYEAFIKAQEESEEISLLNNQRKEGTPNKKDEARRKLERIAYEAIDPELRPASPEELTNELYSQGISGRAGALGDVSASQFEGGNLEGLVSHIPETTLERLALTKEVAERVEDKELLQAYQVHSQLSDLQRRYESGEKISSDERKLLTSAAAGAVRDAKVKAMKKEMEDKGIIYSLDVIDAVSNLQAAAVLASDNDDVVKKYALPGLKLQLEESRKQYEELAAKKGSNVYDVIRDAFKSYAGENEANADPRNLLYAAEKGRLKSREE